VKGREPYIRMYSWFQDTNNAQKLLAWKAERDGKDSFSYQSIQFSVFIALRRTARSVATTHNVKSESNNNPSKRRYLFTDEQRRVLKQIFENEPYPSQARLEQLVEELSLPMNKISNWFHNARMRAKTNIHSTDENKLSTLPDDDEDDLPTIVPLTSSWLNGTADSDSSTSPLSLSATSTNLVSFIDDQKPTFSITSSSSSSKKRKSVPQKIITTKKLIIDSTTIENDNYEETTATNESVDVLS
jgi:hypothetical protein